MSGLGRRHGKLQMPLEARSAGWRGLPSLPPSQVAPPQASPLPAHITHRLGLGWRWLWETKLAQVEEASHLAHLQQAPAGQGTPGPLSPLRPLCDPGSGLR